MLYCLKIDVPVHAYCNHWFLHKNVLTTRTVGQFNIPEPKFYIWASLIHAAYMSLKFQRSALKLVIYLSIRYIYIKCFPFPWMKQGAKQSSPIARRHWSLESFVKVWKIKQNIVQRLKIYINTLKRGFGYLKLQINYIHVFLLRRIKIGTFWHLLFDFSLYYVIS